MIRVAPSLPALAEAAADAAFPGEACGLLVGHRENDGLFIETLLVTPNRAPAGERDRRFRIDPAMHAALQRRLRGTAGEIVGVFHSHPQGPARPSAEDLRAPLREGWVMLILARAGKDENDWRMALYAGPRPLAWRLA